MTRLSCFPMGNTAWMADLGDDVASVAAQAEALRALGASLKHLAVDNKLSGMLAVSEPVKTTTADAQDTLRNANIRVVMATGKWPGHRRGPRASS